MKKKFCHILFLTIASTFLVSCASVPVTNRRQLDLVPGSMMLLTGFKQYDDFLKTHHLSSNQQQTQMVKSVGAKIQEAVEQYMADNNLSGRLRNYQWEFNLVEGQEANAWCMSGGKVVVYTGILPVTQDENGLAVVMGHEIAHAIARHGEERMSQFLLTDMGGRTLSAALSDSPKQTQQLWLTAFGIGSQVGFLLPYSRLHESEADRLGLIFIAMAGYNPDKAVEFWERMSMSKEKQSKRLAEFLSTHPSDQKRIQQIKTYLPEAMNYYKR